MIYSRTGWNGGKLAFLLGCSVSFPHGNEDPSHAWTKNRTRNGKLPRNINLGCKKKYLPTTDKNCLNYNSQSSSDKLFSFEAFGKAGIPHPRVIPEKAIREGSVEVPLEFLGRKNNSFAGRGIVRYSLESWKKAKRAPGWKPHDFYVEFLPFKSEHRIHIFLGNDICHLNKQVKLGDTNFIHTLEQGSPLIIGAIDHPQKNKMVKLAVQAITAIGLQFGAVDIFVDIYDNIYVLEVNSDPGMPGIIGYLYAEEIRRVYQIPQPDYYFCNSEGGVTEVDPCYFFTTPEYKRKKLNVKSEDFSYQNEGKKMKR
jgi:hypothetical protein